MGDEVRAALATAAAEIVASHIDSYEGANPDGIVGCSVNFLKSLYSQYGGPSYEEPSPYRPDDDPGYNSRSDN